MKQDTRLEVDQAPLSECTTAPTALRGCASISARLGDALPGTAPTAVGWLLLEHDGPWDPDAPWSLLDPVIADELRRTSAAAGVRVLGVRRSAGRRASDKPRACYAVSSGHGQRSIARLDLAEPKQLLDLDLDAVARGDMPPGARRVDGPLFAVCTHGRRDACCAREGLPLLRALRRMHPGLVWETTHLGGHRFAPTVVVLPDGLVYGRVDPTDARLVADAALEGQVVTRLLRGRSALAPAVQAAEWFVRDRTGLAAQDVVEVFAAELTEDRAWAVDVRAGEQRLRVVVAHRPTGCERMTSCDDRATEDPGRWAFVSMVAQAESAQAVSATSYLPTSTNRRVPSSARPGAAPSAP